MTNKTKLSLPPTTPALQTFQFKGQLVRHEIINDELWLCLKDVCAVLDIKQPASLKRRLNPHGVRHTHVTVANGRRRLIYINEANLYKAIFKSEKPEALEFEDKVTSEILPSIRKTGTYTAGQPRPISDAPAVIDCRDVEEYYYKDKLIRVISQPGGFWFVAADIHRTLNIAGSGGSHVNLLKNYPNGCKFRLADFGGFKVNILNEECALARISRSYKPEAMPLKKWFIKTLLPKLHAPKPQTALPLPAPQAPLLDEAAVKKLIVETLTELILNTNAVRGRE